MKNIAQNTFVAVMAIVVLVMTDRHVHSAEFQKSYALVIGIDRYQSSAWSSLDYAVKDARAMASYLGQQGFEVQTLYDDEATRFAILNHLNENLAPQLTANDRVIIFFAGHGGTQFRAERNHGYIVPFDGGSGYASNIQMDELRTSALMMDRARHVLFIMDACYGGLLAATRGSKIDDDHPTYLDEVTRRKARQVLTAGGADQEVADGGPGGHSQFTYHLLEALRRSQADLNGDGFITFAELAAYIVPVAHTFRQTPTYSTMAGHGLGEFVFFSKENPPAPPAQPIPTEPAPTRGVGGSYPEVLSFVMDFFKANNDEDVDALLRMFSTNVDYFSWGPTRPHKVKGDKESFFKRWPDVEYTPIGEPEVTAVGLHQYVVKIQFDFYVRSMQRCEGKHGESSFELGIQKILGDWKVISIKENVYFRDKAFNPC